MVIGGKSNIILGSEQTFLLDNKIQKGSIINIGSKTECNESIQILERSKRTKISEENDIQIEYSPECINVINI